MDNPLTSEDPDVWNALISAVHPEALIVAIAYRMGPELRRRLSPEDILQETFLKAWRSRGTFAWQGVRSFRRWLLQIAENCVEDERDSSRTLKRNQALTVSMTPRRGFGDPSSSDDGGLDPWTSTTPSRIAGARERAAAMESSLKDLPDDQREVVRLRLFEDLQIDEIASRLGIGESAVRHRFRKGAELYGEKLKLALGPPSATDARNPNSAVNRDGQGHQSR